MDPDKLPSRPVIVSQTQAARDFSAWAVENDFHHLRDTDGLVWQLHAQVLEGPNPDDMHGGIYQTNIEVAAEVSCADLLATGTLTEEADARLMEIIGTETRIPFRMKTIKLTASSAEELRAKFSDAVAELKQQFIRTQWREIKRRLVCQYVDDACQFGASRLAPTTP